MVADLINPITRSWKANILTKFFDKNDSDAILKLPLAQSFHVDRMVWCGKLTGTYTVRSGYKRLVQGNPTSNINSSTSNNFYK